MYADYGAVEDHIAIEVVAHSSSVERDQTVIGVIIEAAIGSIDNITCRVIAELLGGNDRIVTRILDYSRSNSAETVISITHLGRIFKT